MTTNIIKVTRSAKQTFQLGFKLAKQLLRKGPRKQAVVVALMGELGSGKTTFLQGFARGLGIKEKILSPTFIIFRRFTIYGLRFKNFYHFDCYRINKMRELYDLGWKVIIKNPQNIVVVEWAEHVGMAIPKDAIWVTFDWKGRSEREIRLNGHMDLADKKAKRKI